MINDTVLKSGAMWYSAIRHPDKVAAMVGLAKGHDIMRCGSLSQ